MSTTQAPANLLAAYPTPSGNRVELYRGEAGYYTTCVYPDGSGSAVLIDEARTLEHYRHAARAGGVLWNWS